MQAEKRRLEDTIQTFENDKSSKDEFSRTVYLVYLKDLKIERQQTADSHADSFVVILLWGKNKIKFGTFGLRSSRQLVNN